MASLTDKFLISLGSAALFAGVNFAGTYKLTNALLPFNLFNNATNCPTQLGLLLHALVFFLVTLGTMGDPRTITATKVGHALSGTFLFYFLSSPAMYALMSSLFGTGVASAGGCPTFFGVILHAAVYLLALVGLMYL